MPLTDDPRVALATRHQRELRELRKHLHDLTATVACGLGQIDVLMQQPSTVERGKAIAQVVNVLEMANDRAMHFGLGMSFPAIHRLKKTVLTNG